jgi:hypothetical protein
MGFQVSWPVKTLATLGAVVRLLPCVNFLLSFQVPKPVTTLSTVGALVSSCWFGRPWLWFHWVWSFSCQRQLIFLNRYPNETSTLLILFILFYKSEHKKLDSSRTLKTQTSLDSNWAGGSKYITFIVVWYRMWPTHFLKHKITKEVILCDSQKLVFTSKTQSTSVKSLLLKGFNTCLFKWPNFLFRRWQVFKIVTVADVIFWVKKKLRWNIWKDVPKTDSNYNKQKYKCNM